METVPAIGKPASAMQRCRRRVVSFGETGCCASVQLLLSRMTESDPVPFNLTIIETKRLTCLSQLSADELVNTVTIFADSDDVAKAEFIPTLFATVDQFRHFSREDEANRNVLIANLVHLFSDAKTGLVTLSELCLGLSLLCSGGPMARIGMAMGFYQLDGTNGMSRHQLLHFLQQICRMLFALTTLEPSVQEDVNTAAVGMAADVVAHVSKRNSNEEDDGEGPGDGENGVGGSIPVEAFAEWWLESQLDVDESEVEPLVSATPVVAFNDTDRRHGIGGDSGVAEPAAAAVPQRRAELLREYMGRLLEVAEGRGKRGKARAKREFRDVEAGHQWVRLKRRDLTRCGKVLSELVGSANTPLSQSHVDGITEVVANIFDSLSAYGAYTRTLQANAGSDIGSSGGGGGGREGGGGIAAAAAATTAAAAAAAAAGESSDEEEENPAAVAADSTSVPYEHLFVGVRFVLGEDMAGAQIPKRGDSDDDDRHRLLLSGTAGSGSEDGRVVQAAIEAFQLYAQSRIGSSGRANHSFVHRLRSHVFATTARQRIGPTGQPSTGSGLDMLTMGLPELTRFLASTYTCLFALERRESSARRSSTPGNGRKRVVASGNTVTAEKAAFVRSVETVEKYQLERLGLPLGEFVRFYRGAGLFAGETSDVK